MAIITTAFVWLVSIAESIIVTVFSFIALILLFFTFAMADIQYKIVIVGLGLILLLAIYFTVAVYKGWIVLGL